MSKNGSVAYRYERIFRDKDLCKSTSICGSGSLKEKVK